MVSRNKIPKEIYRRTGDIVQRTGTDVRDIKVGGKKGMVNRPGDWIPNPKYRPGDLYSGEPPMIRRKKTTTVTKRGPGWEIKKARARAAEQKRKKEAAAEKERKVKEATAKKAKKVRKVTTQPKGAAVPLPPKVKIEDLPAPKQDLAAGRKRGPEWHIKALERAAAIRGDPTSRTKKQQITEDMQVAERAKKREPKWSGTSSDIASIRNLIRQGALGKRIGPDKMATIDELGPLDDLLVEKTGGKVSKSKGGTVKKMHGGKLHKKKTKTIDYKHHGGQLVADLYD